MEELFSLKNQIIVITGGAGLLGQQHAEAVARAEGNPLLLDISHEKVKAVAETISRKYGVESQGYGVDITNESDIEKNCTDILRHFGKIDSLINNAANNPKVEESSETNFSRLENFPLSIWSSDLAVGLTGAYLCAKHYGHAIARNPAGGSILNISSDLGIIAPDQRLYRIEGMSENMQPVKPVTYSVVKAGLIGLTRYLATYWAEKNVRCNAICPGGVENNQNPEFIERLIERIPLRRMARKDEYQGLIIFLLSQASAYLNGSVIPADGGRSVW